MEKILEKRVEEEGGTSLYTNMGGKNVAWANSSGSPAREPGEIKSPKKNYGGKHKKGGGGGSKNPISRRGKKKLFLENGKKKEGGIGWGCFKQKEGKNKKKKKKKKGGHVEFGVRKTQRENTEQGS